MKIKKETPSLIKRILEQVQSGQVKMRPKSYFILRAILVGLLACLVALFVLYLISFIVFSLRTSGVWFLPGFGFGALGVFFKSLPWLLIIVALALIVVLEIFVKRFSFAYRRPILYSVLGIVILAFLGSFLIIKTPFHPELFWRAREGRLPMMGEFYGGLGLPKLTNVHQGIVIGITDEGFSMETPRGELLTVMATSTDIQENNRVVVLGKRGDNKVEAFDVRKVDDEFDIFQRRPHRPIAPWSR
jgi:hypothetical protein